MTVSFKQGSALQAMSLTPLIDVVFLLLIFFLVTARFEKQDRELAVVLPIAEAAEPMMLQPQELFVNIDSAGSYFLLRKKVDIGEVRRVLRQKAANNPTQSVVIRADRRVPFDYVVSVMDACNKAGITDYTVTTQGVQ